MRRPWFMRRMKGLQHVSASQVAELGTCEYRVMLQDRHGKRTTAEQAIAIEDGSARHERFHEQGQRAAGRTEAKRWCFVASAIYGDSAPETDALRAFRDQALRKSRLGRAAIAMYYRHSPMLVERLEQRPVAVRFVRAILDLVVYGLRRKGRAGGEEC